MSNKRTWIISIAVGAGVIGGTLLVMRQLVQIRRQLSMHDHEGLVNAIADQLEYIKRQLTAVDEMQTFVRDEVDPR